MEVSQAVMEFGAPLNRKNYRPEDLPLNLKILEGCELTCVQEAESFDEKKQRALQQAEVIREKRDAVFLLAVEPLMSLSPEQLEDVETAAMAHLELEALGELSQEQLDGLVRLVEFDSFINQVGS